MARGETTRVDRRLVQTADTLTAAIEVVEPDRQRLPIVLASPHSGRTYPDDLLQASRLDAHALRKSEDGYIDEIFRPAVSLGVPLLRALFPRAYVDTNREAFELDPEMFEDPLPGYVNTRSPRVQAGLGTIARIVAQGEEIYARRLRFAEALRRIETYYQPYHAALRRLTDRTCAQFGYCILLDCHSMPSNSGSPATARAPLARTEAGGIEAEVGDAHPAQPLGMAGPTRGESIDIVLGDYHGGSCAGMVTEGAEVFLREHGFSVARNTPYAGGFTTRYYGKPRSGLHVLQIEINRELYMDERSMARKPFLAPLSETMTEFVGHVGRLPLMAGERTAAQ